MSSFDASPLGVAAVRGAVTVAANTPGDIAEATARLLGRLTEVNRLDTARIISAVFTATPDLDADFPAHAARRLGWSDVPLLCAREIDVPGALARVVRVLLTVSGVPPGRRLVPVYLDGAAALRPDLEASSAERATRPPPARGARTAAARAARRVAIIGLGQIGGSVGLALGERGGWRRVGFDTDAAVLGRAGAAGAIDEPAGTLEAACAGADLAVIATSLEALPEAIGAAAAALAPGAALIDTGSARAGISAALERAAARGIRAVGGHPLAGNEGRGLQAAHADLFRGAPFVLLPADSGVPEVISALVRDLGARPISASPAAHDRALARTSHLPYLVSCALRRLGEEPARRRLSGPGHRDMTRLAGSDPGMAGAFCRANAREVADAWRELREELERRVVELQEPPPG